MPVTRTKSRRYVATCDVADCGWPGEMHRHRIVVSERLRHHLKTEHGLIRTEGTPSMKVQKNTELPEQETGPKLSDFAGELVVFEKGWAARLEKTKFGTRDVIEATLGVYDTDTKTWRHHGGILVFSKVVLKRLTDEGPDDDIGGVLTQGTERNSREWDLVPPSAAQVKLLDKYVSSEEPF